MLIPIKNPHQKGLSYLDVGHNKEDWLWVYDGAVHVHKDGLARHPYPFLHLKDWEFCGRYETKNRIISIGGIRITKSLSTTFLSALITEFPDALYIYDFGAKQ